jgi:integrase
VVGKPNRRGWGHIRKLPSGRFQASYSWELDRHKAPITYTSKQDAEHWLANERRLIEREEWRPPAERAVEKKSRGLTLGEYGPGWIEQRTKHGAPLKARTRSHYRTLFREHIEPRLGRVALKDITPETVRDWHGRTLTDQPTYRAHAYGLLHAMLQTAVTDGHISSNPAQIRGASKAARKRDPVILDRVEVAALADAIEPRLKAFILISAWLGTRFGETTELRRRDVAKDFSVVAVHRGVVHRDGQCIVGSTKSGERRNVTVPDFMRADLAHHLTTYVGKPADSLLFPPTRGGCHLRDKVFRESYYSPALESVGTDKRPTIHDLRHFAGTSAARVGNLVETMGRLGHKTPGASLIYQSIASGRDAEVAEALSRYAKGDQ